MGHHSGWVVEFLEGPSSVAATAVSFVVPTSCVSGYQSSLAGRVDWRAGGFGAVDQSETSSCWIETSSIGEVVAHVVDMVMAPATA